MISPLLSLQSSNDRAGVSFQSVVKYILKKYPGIDLNKKKFFIKKAMKKHLERGTIKQVMIVCLALFFPHGILTSNVIFLRCNILNPEIFVKPASSCFTA